MVSDVELIHYQKVLFEAEQAILEAQQQFLHHSNRISIELYWALGKLLAETAERYQWGQQVLARLSRDLTKNFGSFIFCVENQA